MEATDKLLKKYFRVIAKPVMLVLLYYTIIICFCSILWVIAGDPNQLFIDPGMPPEVREQQRELVKSYGSFLANMLRWNFGVQFDMARTPILPELLWRMRWTLILIGLSTATYVLVGTIIAIIASIRKPKRRRPAILAHSMKGFLFGLTPLIALMFIYSLVLQLDLFPRAGLMSWRPMTRTEGYMDLLAHLFLPVLTLTLVNTFRSAPIVWSSSPSLHSRSSWKIFLLSITTIDFTFMVSGAILVESVYALPGIGSWFIRSLLSNNHPVVFAIFVAFCTIVVSLGIVSTFLELLQIRTGIRGDLERSSSSTLKEQLHERSHVKRQLRSYFERKGLIVGLIIVFFFIVLATTAPLLTPHRPISQLYKAPKQAERYAVPSWSTIFPQYEGYNPTIRVTTDLAQAKVVAVDNPDLLEISLDNMNFNFTPPTDAQRETASVTIDLGNFSYEYMPPPYFTMHVSYEMFFNHTGLETYFAIKNYTAKPLWEEYLLNATNAEMLTNIFTPPKYPIGIIGFTPNHTVHKVDVPSWYDVPEVSPVTSSLYKPEIAAGIPPDPADILLYEEGVYGIRVRFRFIQRTWVRQWDQAWARLYIKEIGITFWGRQYGLLGTDFEGNDSWTEVVYGARTIVSVGFGLAALAVGLGLPFGILAGHFKGWMDNIVMLTAECLLYIPIIPLLLTFTRYFSPSVWSVGGLLLGFLAAITLMAFRNAYKADSIGNRSRRSKFCALLRYSLANLFLIAISISLILMTLSFLGFGDPNVPSWGRMLYHAYQLGGLGAWWVWIPPAAFLLLFVFGLFLVGSSLDET